jgi:hypothetical protein
MNTSDYIGEGLNKTEEVVSKPQHEVVREALVQAIKEAITALDCQMVITKPTAADHYLRILIGDKNSDQLAEVNISTSYDWDKGVENLVEALQDVPMYNRDKPKPWCP